MQPASPMIRRPAAGNGIGAQSYRICSLVGRAIVSFQTTSFYVDVGVDTKMATKYK